MNEYEWNNPDPGDNPEAMEEASVEPTPTQDDEGKHGLRTDLPEIEITKPAPVAEEPTAAAPPVQQPPVAPPQSPWAPVNQNPGAGNNPGTPWQGQPQSPNWGRQGYQQNNQWSGGQWQPPRQQQQPQGYQYSAPPAGTGDGGKKPPQKKKWIRVVSIILVAVLAISLGSIGISSLLSGDDNNGTPASSGSVGDGNSVPDINVSGKPGAGETSYGDVLTPKEIYSQVSPSVVGVVSYLSTSIYGPQSQGSGIVMTADGYIITNAHVVEGAMRVEIVLVDGESFDADVVGSDSRSDLAILKATAEVELTPAEFGDSDEVEVGERVCAIGNPSGLALQSTLTVGYVSALNRMVVSSGSTYAINCIQTDAAINPGNSGGALINEYGQVIGINSIKVIDIDYEGIGFAIPTNDALPIVQDLIANGKVTGRPVLGITASPVTAEEAQTYSIPLGLWIKGFTEGADIATKDVQIDDIITKVDGTPIYSAADCAEVLSDFAPGDTVTLTIYRMESTVRNQTFEVEVLLSGS